MIFIQPKIVLRVAAKSNKKSFTINLHQFLKNILFLMDLIFNEYNFFLVQLNGI